MGWDGNFFSDDCKYKFYDNMVQEVLENGGRVLHEPTADGKGTHEIIDRGGVICEDYYFPKQGNADKHDHYEFRSTGEILINGKPINKGFMELASLQTCGNDEAALHERSRMLLNEGNAILELGVKFGEDMAVLQKRIDDIAANGHLGEKIKQELIADLNKQMQAVREQYRERVEKAREEMERELKKTTDAMQEAADALDKEAQSLRGIKTQVGDVDMEAAAKKAEAEQRKFEDVKRRVEDTAEKQRAAMAQQLESLRKLGEG